MCVTSGYRETPRPFNDASTCRYRMGRRRRTRIPHGCLVIRFRPPVRSRLFHPAYGVSCVRRLAGTKAPRAAIRLALIGCLLRSYQSVTPNRFSRARRSSPSAATAARSPASSATPSRLRTMFNSSRIARGGGSSFASAPSLLHHRFSTGRIREGLFSDLPTHIPSHAQPSPRPTPRLPTIASPEVTPASRHASTRRRRRARDSSSIAEANSPAAPRRI